MYFSMFTPFKLHLAALLFSALFVANCMADISGFDYRQMAQLAEYVSADYSNAVDNAEIINEGEYQEMLEFS